MLSGGVKCIVSVSLPTECGKDTLIIHFECTGQLRYGFFSMSFSPYHGHIPGECGVGDRNKKVKEFRGTEKKKEKDK